MAAKPLIFRVHAIERMAQRGIRVEDVRRILDVGELVEDYPADFPYPSAHARMDRQPANPRGCRDRFRC